MDSYRLDETGALIGDDLLERLRDDGFWVRLDGDDAGLCHNRGFGHVPYGPDTAAFTAKRAEYVGLLKALKAPDIKHDECWRTPSDIEG